MVAMVKPRIEVNRSAAAFAQHGAQLIGTQLVACEERFPDGESSSVLVVVVDRHAATWGERLKPLYEKLFENKHPGSPENVRLEVIDRSTQEAIRRLCEAGLLQLRIRATRHLHPKGDLFPVVLSDEETRSRRFPPGTLQTQVKVGSYSGCRRAARRSA
jgi:hypothetical protein